MIHKVNKVLLFIPPAVTFNDDIDINPLPPLGLAYLGAVLEKNGIQVKIVDSLAEGWNNRIKINDNIIRIGLSFEQIGKIINDFNPDIVGVNNLFTKQRNNAHKIYALTKKIDKNIITVGGGAHPTAMPELALSDENLDYVVLGEGEHSFIELIKVIEGKSNLSALDGIGYKENGKIKIIPKTNFIRELDLLPFPAWHLLNMEGYFGLKSSHGQRTSKCFSPVITSRGCPAQCTFCSAHKVWGRQFRSRSAENVVRELKQIREEYGIEEILFEDDNLTLDPERAERIFDGMIEERLNLKWDTPNGIAAWTLNERLIDKMKESGCFRLNFALESGNQEVLDHIIRKPVQLEKVKPLVEYARKIGIEVGIYLVLGMPGETQEQIWDSFRLAEELGIFSPFISIATPYPGSELYELCRKKQYLRDDFNLDDLYIKSFSISTQDMDGQKLKKIVSQGHRYLLFASLRKAPLFFLKKVIMKFAHDPVSAFGKVFEVIFKRERLRNCA